MGLYGGSLLWWVLSVIGEGWIPTFYTRTQFYVLCQLTRIEVNTWSLKKKKSKNFGSIHFAKEIWQYDARAVFWTFIMFNSWMMLYRSRAMKMCTICINNIKVTCIMTLENPREVCPFVAVFFFIYLFSHWTDIWAFGDHLCSASPPWCPRLSLCVDSDLPDHPEARRSLWERKYSQVARKVPCCWKEKEVLEARIKALQRMSAKALWPTHFSA